MLNGSRLEFSLCFQQGELEKLNQSTDDINRCETELEVSRSQKSQLLCSNRVISTQVFSPGQSWKPLIQQQHSCWSAPLSVLTFDLRHGLHDPQWGPLWAETFILSARQRSVSWFKWSETLLVCGFMSDGRSEHGRNHGSTAGLWFFRRP